MFDLNSSSSMKQVKSFPNLPIKTESPKPSNKPPKPLRKLHPDVNLDFLNPPKKPETKVPTPATAAEPQTEIVTKYVEDVLEPELLAKAEPLSTSRPASLTDPLSLQSSTETSMAIDAIKSEPSYAVEQQPQTSYSLDQQLDTHSTSKDSYQADEAATAAAGILAQDEPRFASLPATIPEFNEGYGEAPNYPNFEAMGNETFGQQYHTEESNSDLNAAFTG